MSTILNALKKAKTDREKTGKAPGPPGGSGQGGLQSPGGSDQINLGERGRVEHPAHGRAAGRGGRRSPGEPASYRASEPLPRAASWTRTPATAASSPAAGSSIPWLVVVVGLLAAVGGGGFVFFVLSHGSSNNGNGGAYAAASMAPAANAAPTGGTSINPTGEGAAGAIPDSKLKSETPETSADAVGSKGVQAEERASKESRAADLKKPEQRAEGAASKTGTQRAPGAASHAPMEVASSEMPIVKIKPQEGGQSGEHEGGGKIPPGSIAPQSIEDYVNFLQQGSGMSVGVGARGEQITPTPYATITPYPPMHEQQGTSAVDNATSPPTATPIRTPRPTPSIPPVPTLYPDGSHVMAIDLGLRIEGIMWDPSSPSALVNDRIVHEGDIVNRVKILKINKNDLTVEYHGRKLFAQY